MKPGPDADAVLLAHMLECLDRVRAYVGGSKQAFLGSTLIQDAVLRKLQTLTESSQRLSEPLKASAPGVPWRELAGFRNVIVHGYLGVDLEAVWLVIEADLPPLEAALRRLAGRDGSDGHIEPK